MNLVQYILNRQELIDYYDLRIVQIPEFDGRGRRNSYARLFRITNSKQQDLHNILTMLPGRIIKLLHQNSASFQGAVIDGVYGEDVLFADLRDARKALEILLNYLKLRDQS